MTQSAYLVEHSRNQYYGSQYDNSKQNISFLSFNELLQTWAIPEGREVHFRQFEPWFRRHNQQYKFADASQIFEEFKGVITGSVVTKPFLRRGEYLNLGLKQSIFMGEQRELVYDLFEKFRRFLMEEGFYEMNMTSYNYLDLVKPTYDAVVVDEVQDLTLVQLKVIMQTLKDPDRFLLYGDSNQIVHPNFFSWDKIKSYFYKDHTGSQKELVQVLSTNYRSAKPVTEFANNLLKIKQRRFGSIDRESNHLIQSLEYSQGEVRLIKDKEKTKRSINEKTKMSTNYAVLVLDESQKFEAQTHFQTPLIFSVREAKGLEYENVILYNIVSGHRKIFQEIVDSVEKEDLDKKELEYRRAKSKSDKSLEVYKFYINALYVASSRSIKNLLIIESDHRNELWHLCGLKGNESEIEIKEEESSREDWQREARKLELQGKIDQAKNIRSQILQIEPVPWVVLDREKIEDLLPRAFDRKAYDKKAQRQVFAYAHTYHEETLYGPLVEAKFGMAKSPENGGDFVIKRFTPGFDRQKPKELTELIKKHGTDFPNPLSQTPLMTAARLGESERCKILLDSGAKTELTDLWDLNAFEISLKEALFKPSYAKDFFGEIYSLLAPSAINLKVGDRLVKLDNRLMEFFMLKSMMLMFSKLAHRSDFFLPAFKSADFLEAFEAFDERVLPDRRKKRAYISSILSKNEVNSKNLYNRKLFIRIPNKRGLYLFNPQVCILRGEEWVPIYQSIGLEWLQLSLSSAAWENVSSFVQHVESLQSVKP